MIYFSVLMIFGIPQLHKVAGHVEKFLFENQHINNIKTVMKQAKSGMDQRKNTQDAKAVSIKDKLSPDLFKATGSAPKTTLPTLPRFGTSLLPSSAQHAEVKARA